MKTRACSRTGMVLGSVLIAATAGASSVMAETVLVGNLDEPFRANTPIANPEFWGAQSFVCDATDRTLVAVYAIVGNGANSPQVVAELRAADVNGEVDSTPGGLLTTFTSPDMFGPETVRSFAPDAAVTLMAGQKYWFILGSANAGTYDWSYANTDNSTGLGTLGNFADSSDAGATWVYRDQSFPYFIQVTFETPRGACCRGDGLCIPEMDAFTCQVEFQGTYLGDGSQCTANACCSGSLVVSNVGEPFRADTPIANPQYWGAQSFQVDDNDRMLISIDAIVGNAADTPQVVAELRHAEAGGGIDMTPAGLLTTLSGPDLSGATSVRSFTPDAPVTLMAGQSYWFVLGTSNQGTYAWSYADTAYFSGPGGLVNFADSSDGGATWNLGDNTFFYFIQVNAGCGGPTGACCIDHGDGTGTCQELSTSTCAAAGGSYMGDGTLCASGQTCDFCPDDPEKLDAGACGCGVPDTDGDSDAVPDCLDLCPNTVPGAVVDGVGCPPYIRFDFDADGDVDLTDLGVFDGCGSGPAIPHDSSPDCLRSDADSDNDVDSTDFGAFQRCYSGQGKAADPNCACEGGTCGGACIDLMWDGLNCGTCGNRCSPQEYCAFGQCQGSCIGCE